MTSSQAIRESEFGALMAPLAPFERPPRLAVAVSGGADSMALLLLAARWARRRNGQVTALTVDHRLRPEAKAEARQVARWCRARGIAQRTLIWRDDKPTSGIEAAARSARYRLLGGYCRAHGILHLLSAHHRDDQVETVLLRLSRQSGLTGLAGMAAVSRLPGLRLLRPLLPVGPERLRDTLHASGQDWLEDPSNHDFRFARARLRAAMAAQSAPEGLRGGIVHLARQAGCARHDGAAELAGAAAGIVDLFPAGYATTAPGALQTLPRARRLGLLSALLTSIGGRQYPPDRAALARLDRRLSNGKAGTLHGCLARPHKHELLICRESGRLPPPLSAASGGAMWDRFQIRFPARRQDLKVAALGAAGWLEIKPHLGITPPPPPVRPCLPALWLGDTVLAVPHLGFVRANTGLPLQRFSAIFTPSLPLVEFGLRIV